MDFKSALIDALDAHRRAELANKAVFKAKAYAKVIEGIRGVSGPIHSFDDLTSNNVKGIGASIEAKIRNVFIAPVDSAKSDNAQAARLLEKIYGVGPVKAQELVSANIKDYESLRAALITKPELLNDKQKIGLAHVHDLNERIPRSEMDLHAQMISSVVKNTGLTHEIVGSYRREAKDSGDIDVLLKGTDPSGLKSVVSMLKDRGYIIETLAEGQKKFMGICKLKDGKARRLDILLTPPEEYAYAILYFTGSDKFNVAMRKQALELGYTMNEHGMSTVRDGVAPAPLMKNEKDIFKFLKLSFVDPVDRVG